MEQIEKKTQLQSVRRRHLRPTEAGALVRDAVPMVPRQRSIFKRLAFTGLIGGGLVYTGLQLSPTSGPPPEYKTEKVTRGALIREVIASGPLIPAFKAEVDSLVAGTALAVHADFGAQVNAGQPLAEIDPATAKLSLKEAEIGVGSAWAAVEVAKSRAQQFKTLMEDKLIPRIDYEKAAADLDQAIASARIAEANVSRARIGVQRCTVRSPLKGVVIARNVDVGQSVDTGNNTPPLFVIASDLSKMQIEANVAESDIGGVRKGMEATFTVDAFPDEKFKGRITQVRTVPVVDQTVVNYPVIIETANKDLRLKPGMTASVIIVVDRRDDVLTIPNKALRFRPPEDPDAAKKKSKRSSDKDKNKGDKDGDGSVKTASAAPAKTDDEDNGPRVYRLVRHKSAAADEVTGSSVEMVAIKTGLTDGKQTEVLEGVNEGDRLVVAMKKSDDEKRGLFSRLPEILSGATGKKK